MGTKVQVEVVTTVCVLFSKIDVAREEGFLRFNGSILKPICVLSTFYCNCKSTINLLTKTGLLLRKKSQLRLNQTGKVFKNLNATMVSIATLIL